MFSCEFCEISKNTFPTEHLQTTASEKKVLKFSDKIPLVGAVLLRCSYKNVFWKYVVNLQENTHVEV